MDIELELSPTALLPVVSGLVRYREVKRQSLSRWRKDLGMPNPPYTLDHAKAIAYYADRLALGVKPERAKQLTIKYLEASEDGEAGSAQPNEVRPRVHPQQAGRSSAAS